MTKLTQIPNKGTIRISTGVFFLKTNFIARTVAITTKYIVNGSPTCIVPLLMTLSVTNFVLKAK